MNLLSFIKSDCYRISGCDKFRTILKQVLFGETFKYLFWMRICYFSDKKLALKLVIFPIAKFMLTHYKFKFGICLSYRTVVGSGIYFPHFGGIVINDNSVLGDNITISQGVTIGKTDRGKYIGCPEIGSNVFIGPNAVIVGKIKIGSNVLIAGNSFVNFSLPDNCIISGNPARIISFDKGAGEYVKRPWLINDNES